MNICCKRIKSITITILKKEEEREWKNIIMTKAIPMKKSVKSLGKLKFRKI